MGTLQPGTVEPFAAVLADGGMDPLGSAASLRSARLRPAPLTARAGQVLVDLGTMALLLAVPALGVLVGVLVLPVPPVVPAVAATLAVVVVLLGALVVWPWHDGGRTAGMRWAGLRVADGEGREPTASALAVRALLLPLDAVVGLPVLLLRTDRRRLGDLLAGTQVVVDLSVR